MYTKVGFLIETLRLSYQQLLSINNNYWCFSK